MIEQTKPVPKQMGNVFGTQQNIIQKSHLLATNSLILVSCFAKIQDIHVAVQDIICGVNVLDFDQNLLLVRLLVGRTAAPVSTQKKI